MLNRHRQFQIFRLFVIIWLFMRILISQYGNFSYYNFNLYNISFVRSLVLIMEILPKIGVLKFVIGRLKFVISIKNIKFI